MVTGLYPAAHGAERNNAALATEAETLPEAFQDAGYLTAAVSANPAFVTPLQGFAQGFGEFTVKRGRVSEDPRRPIGDATPSDPWMQSMVEVATAEEITQGALTWVAGHDHAPAPYFLYAHYFDPHAGYFPPPEYATRFGVAEDDPIRGDAQWPLLLSFKAPADPRDTAKLVQLYDAEIAYTDAQVGALIDGIRARTKRPTYFIVLSDHGEEFDDHGGIQHGRTLYDELLRVPLLVVGPGIAPGHVVKAPVSLVGLWPTLTDMVGIHPPARADGASFAPLARGGKPDRSQNLFADLEARFKNDALVHRRAVMNDTWKLITGPARSVPQLFDMLVDPKERADVPEPGPRQMLRAILNTHETASRQVRRSQPPDKIELTPERRERLKALGYLE
jgi:arylsulfatase A-like enzyme